MREFTKGNTHYRIFDDITTMLEKFPKGIPRVLQDCWNIESFVGKKFNVWQQIADEARKSCPLVTKSVQGMIEELEGIEISQPMIHKRKPRFKEDQGDEIDNDRLRSGQDYWRVCQREATIGSQVKTIVIDMATRATKNAKDIHWRGASAITLCHLLENAGYQCEIYAVAKCSRSFVNEDGHFHAMLLKDSFGTIDIDSMTTAVSGWFYRTVWFSMIEAKGQRTSAGLGAPRNVEASDLVEADLAISTTSEVDLIIVDDVYSNWQAENLVKRVLGQYAPKSR